MLLICSRNKGKVEEIKSLLAQQTVSTLDDVELSAGVPYSEPLENADFFLANGLAKALCALSFVLSHAPSLCGMSLSGVLCDDSGLCVPALSFLPGVHSATFGGEPRSDDKNNARLMSMVQGHQDAVFYENERRLDAFFISLLVMVRFRKTPEELSVFLPELSFVARQAQTLVTSFIEKKSVLFCNLKTLVQKNGLFGTFVPRFRKIFPMALKFLFLRVFVRGRFQLNYSRISQVQGMGMILYFMRQSTLIFLLPVCH